MGLGYVSGSRLGADESLGALASPGMTAYPMSALNTGWAGRFTALSALDIYSVWINWSGVTAPGSVRVRIETVDANGKPSGTLYDPNATVDITPATGWQQATFATPPATGLTPGTEYCLVLLTVTGGTTHNLQNHISNNAAGARYPTVALTAADGTARTNFAEVVASIPCASFVLSDGSETAQTFIPFVIATTFTIFGTKGAGLKFTTLAPVSVRGYNLNFCLKAGSPTNLRFRIFDAANNVIAGSTATLNVASLSGLSTTRRVRAFLSSALTLPAGTYRLVIDQTDHTSTSLNNYTIYHATARSASLVPGGLIYSSTTNLDATPIVWTDTATDQTLAALILDDLVASHPSRIPSIG